MNSWRLSRYDPSRRDESGRFLGHEWTSVTDIGQEFEGGPLTQQCYIRAENAHVAVVLAFYGDLGAPKLIAHDGEQNNTEHVLAGLPDAELNVTVLEGVVISDAEKLEKVVRCCLREWLWCRLGDEAGTFGIQFGYDYYVYLTGQRMSVDVARLARSLGLFLEPLASPYL